jgi:hypothetical protein
MLRLLGLSQIVLIEYELRAAIQAFHQAPPKREVNGGPPFRPNTPPSTQYACVRASTAFPITAFTESEMTVSPTDQSQRTGDELLSRHAF